MSLPGGFMVKNLPANAGDTSSILGSGKSLGRGNGNPIQYSCLENPTHRGPWWAAVYEVSKSQTWLRMHKSMLEPNTEIQGRWRKKKKKCVLNKRSRWISRKYLIKWRYVTCPIESSK